MCSALQHVLCSEMEVRNFNEVVLDRCQMFRNSVALSPYNFSFFLFLHIMLYALTDILGSIKDV